MIGSESANREANNAPSGKCSMDDIQLCSSHASKEFIALKWLSDRVAKYVSADTGRGTPQNFGRIESMRR